MCCVGSLVTLVCAITGYYYVIQLLYDVIQMYFVVTFPSNLFFVASVGAIAVNADFFNEGSGPVLLNSVTCNGNESSLLDCAHVAGEAFRCPTSGVVCQGKLQVLSCSCLYN